MKKKCIFFVKDCKSVVSGEWLVVSFFRKVLRREWLNMFERLV